ncbi:MAG TPA: DUF1203 domain-containing protein [Candidatus Acidoferrum sp.]|nr:DUF1203 domain-containing protein [Candidatus Acidoferrum sp.]
MSSFQVVAISTKIVELVRSGMRSPGYGHPAYREIATGYGPCRHCLRAFRIGIEERILFTYDPFHELGVDALPGPIFVHADACERYAEDAGFPGDLRTHALLLDVYGAERRLVAEESVTNESLDERVEHFLQSDDIKYIHVRDKQAGCYDLRIEPRTRNQQRS